MMKIYFSFLVIAGILVLGIAVSPQSAFAAKFVCTLVEIPPYGTVVSPDRFMKGFDFDTADVPADATTQFKNLRLSLHSDGKFITMKLSDISQTSVAAVSSFESEIRTMIDDKAEAYCVTRDVLDNAVPVEVGVR